MSKRGSSPLEELVVLIIIAIFIALIYQRYKVLSLKTQLEVAKGDLRNLRLEVKLFKIRNGRFPSSLYELYKKGYLQKNIQKSTIKDHTLIDPFGYPYIYDNKTGKIVLNPHTQRLLEKLNK